MDHAYSHLIGTTLGVRLTARGPILAATVLIPNPGQDDNLLTVKLGDGSLINVPYMETYRADFVTKI